MYDIRKSKIQYFKSIHKSIMAAQKRKKKIVSRKIFAFLNVSFPKTHLIQSLNSLGSSRPYGRLLANQKTGGSKELFLPKSDLQNSPKKFFPKKHADFGGLQTNRRHKILTRTFLHMPFYI